MANETVVYGGDPGAANQAAVHHAFADYRACKADNTLRAQAGDLAHFAEFLGLGGLTVTGGELQNSPVAWAGVTWDLVEAWKQAQLRAGSAVATINRRLSTVKKYAAIAAKAGAIKPTEAMLIQAVQGFGGKEAKRMDERRRVTRVGAKKARHVTIAPAQAKTLKAQPDTPQGRRDALLMCLLLDHGLRVGEVARLEATDFDLAGGKMTFYRPKVDGMQTHKLTADTLRCLSAWIRAGDAPIHGPILRGSRKGGALTSTGVSERNLSERVRVLGERIGLNGLSAYDCRHYWATQWAGKVDLYRLREAGGWASLAMPRRYTKQAAVANEGMC
jgi:integrase